MDGMLNSEKWTDAEVQALLAMYATEEVQRDLEGSIRNIKIFGKIATELAHMGFYHTAKQCREKVKKLKQDYKKIKDHNNQSGANRKTSKWYATLDGILGHRPAYSGNANTKDSATGFLETIVGSENSAPLDESLQATAPEPMASFLLDPVTPSTSAGCEQNFCVPPVGSSTPRRPTPAKRKRPDSSILSAVENLLESDSELRRDSDLRYGEMLQFLKDQAKTEAEERAALVAREEEMTRFQAHLMESLLRSVNRLAPRQDDQ